MAMTVPIRIDAAATGAGRETPFIEPAGRDDE